MARVVTEQGVPHSSVQLVCWPVRRFAAVIGLQYMWVMGHSLAAG